ncbi:helix-turn-helix domain-containing protein [Methylobacterium sp. CB376]|uniref:helix-turn-helix domain-containing protein n=1 Tax=unclassified Methylobacterium TaxID=2615210 RepID=UPI0009FC2126|nr:MULTISPECIES: helix-turn-helix domain-containing protein [Methylobacterium]WFT81406.1 helix-turn-helix domain-containing protein [Methylobacterium nodulans]
MTRAGLLTPMQAAAYLGICRETLRAHVKHGDLSYIDIGRGTVRRRMMFHPDDLAAFIEARRQRQCQSTNPKADRTTSMISSSAVIDFTALRAARASAKPKLLKKSAAKKRQSK